MENTMFLWNSGLSLIMVLIGAYVRAKEKELDETKAELNRISILVSKTREEAAEKFITKTEVHADINRVLDRLDRLDEKLDRLMEIKNAK